MPANGMADLLSAHGGGRGAVAHILFIKLRNACEIRLVVSCSVFVRLVDAYLSF